MSGAFHVDGAGGFNTSPSINSFTAISAEAGLASKDAPTSYSATAALVNIFNQSRSGTGGKSMTQSRSGRASTGKTKTDSVRNMEEQEQSPEPSAGGATSEEQERVKRVQMILQAVKEMVDAGKDLTKTGKPELQVLKVRAAMRDITAEERDEAFASLEGALSQAASEPEPTAFKTELSKHDLENLVQITGRCMRRNKPLTPAYLGSRIACLRVTDNDVKWSKAEVLRRSPTNDKREIVAQAIWP